MKKYLPSINVIAYLLLVVINFLALQIPFFGNRPGDVSDLYAHPFTPADFTFKIWPVIYVLLGGYILYQSTTLFQTAEKKQAEVDIIGYFFLATSSLNVLWLLTWQSQQIPLAFLLIFSLWALLVLLNYRLTVYPKTNLMVYIPLSCYLGWVSVAGLANLNVLLMYVGFDFFGISPENWAILLVIITGVGGLLLLYINANYWILLVIVWAFWGIYQKNIDLLHILPQVTLGMMVMVLLVAVLAWRRTRRLYPDRRLGTYKF